MLKPLPLQIDITNSCNLRCKHCYHSDHSNAGAVDLNTWLEVLRQYKDLLTECEASGDIILCGGEPLLSPHFKPLLSNISETFPGSRVTVLTNGTLISDRILEFLQSLELKIDFQLSIDGPDEPSHDEFRGKGSFQRTIAGAAKLTASNFEVALCAVLTQRNTTRIRPFFQLAQSMSIRSMSFTRFIPVGFGQGLQTRGEDRSPTPQELKSAYQQILLSSAEFRINTNHSSSLYALLHPQLGGTRFDNALVVDYQGKILVSSRSRLQLGDIRTDSLRSIYFEHPILQALRSNKIEGCDGCSLLNRCGGDRNVAFAATGNFLGFDPGCWKTQKTA